MIGQPNYDSEITRMLRCLNKWNSLLPMAEFDYCLFCLVSKMWNVNPSSILATELVRALERAKVEVHRMSTRIQNEKSEGEAACPQLTDSQRRKVQSCTDLVGLLLREVAVRRGVQPHGPVWVPRAAWDQCLAGLERLLQELQRSVEYTDPESPPGASSGPSAQDETPVVGPASPPCPAPSPATRTQTAVETSLRCYVPMTHCSGAERPDSPS